MTTIEIGKTYTVEPAVKKSFVEFECFRKGDKYVRVETGWRYGDLNVTITNEEEQNYLQEVLDSDGEEAFDAQEFEDIEMLSTWDGCWQEYHYVGVEEDEQEILQEGMDEEGFWDYLQENGWETVDLETYIYNGITVTEYDGNQV